ncbi:EthD family reductase [Acidimicrobiaceae bacterium USS-CC1]|uniref:EthD family reductase n=1 Tax=Acidiferrimicrobium australe TaxID=2664430 RepID=A0ABW9QR54_9ACTN|nr:EthD family reductase [Acidiferrimicrobium australe]
MVKLIVLYGHPTDPAAFDAHYSSTHADLVAKMPGVRRFEVAKCTSVDGSASPYYLQAELWFDDAAALQGCLASPEGRAAAADVPNFATGGATMLTGEVLAGE